MFYSFISKTCRCGGRLVTPDLESTIRSYHKNFSDTVSLGTGIGWFDHSQKSYQTYLPRSLRNGHLTQTTAMNCNVHAMNLGTICTQL